MSEVDENFYARADEHINLANKQLQNESMGKVSASMMFSVARFNAWVSACGWDSGAAMASAKAETLDYFVEEYRKMLNENLDDYIDHFDEYMQPEK